MAPQKVLITGASGLLGRQIFQAFKEDGWDTIGTGYYQYTRVEPPAIQKVDITDQTAVQKILDQERPHVVVHSAANRFPDKCDADVAGATLLNVTATRYLARATAARNILLLYISTDYVFPGKEGEAPYEADAPTGPTNLYGQTKLDGERATIEEAGKLGVVLRVPVLYGSVTESTESAINVLVDIVWKTQEKSTGVRMDDWAQRFPTNTEDVGRVCKDTASRYLSTDSATLPRILQFSSKDRFTKYEICEMMAEILGLPMDGIVADKQGSNPGSKIQRPYDTHLSTQALEQIGVPVSNVFTQDFRAWW